MGVMRTSAIRSVMKYLVEVQEVQEDQEDQEGQ
jgi:hypothetical protein